MNNKRLATVCFALAAAFIMISSASVVATTAPGAPIDIMRGSATVTDGALLTGTIGMDTHNVSGTVTTESSVLPTDGAYLRINGIGEAAGTAVTLAMKVSFDPIEGEDNLSGQWLLESGLKVTLVHGGNDVAQVLLQKDSTISPEGTVSTQETFKKIEGGQVTEDDAQIIIGENYTLKMETSSGIDVTSKDLSELKNMRFIFIINGTAISVTFKNGDLQLIVEILSDHLVGPTETPKSSDKKYNVFVGWNKDSTVTPNQAQWADKIKGLQPETGQTNVDLFAIFAERGDMDGNKLYEKADPAYLMLYINARGTPMEDLVPIKQDPIVTPGSQEITKGEAAYLMLNYNSKGTPMEDLVPLSQARERGDWDD